MTGQDRELAVAQHDLEEKLFVPLRPTHQQRPVLLRRLLFSQHE
jgi:hypothetical protein